MDGFSSLKLKFHSLRMLELVVHHLGVLLVNLTAVTRPKKASFRLRLQHHKTRHNSPKLDTIFANFSLFSATANNYFFFSASRFFFAKKIPKNVESSVFFPRSF